MGALLDGVRTHQSLVTKKGEECEWTLLPLAQRRGETLDAIWETATDLSSVIVYIGVKPIHDADLLRYICFWSLDPASLMTGLLERSA